MKLTVQKFVPGPASLKWLLEKFIKHKDEWGIDLPTNPIDFTCLIAGHNAATFVVSADGEPLGIHLFTDIVPGDSAVAHIYFWDTRFKKARITTCRTILIALMEAFDLYRIAALTPKWNVVRFAQAVGLTLEGTLRKAVVIGSERVDGWLLSLIKEDMEGFLDRPFVVQ